MSDKVTEKSVVTTPTSVTPTSSIILRYHPEFRIKRGMQYYIDLSPHSHLDQVSELTSKEKASKRYAFDYFDSGYCFFYCRYFIFTLLINYDLDLRLVLAMTTLTNRTWYIFKQMVKLHRSTDINEKIKFITTTKKKTTTQAPLIETVIDDFYRSNDHRHLAIEIRERIYYVLAMYLIFYHDSSRLTGATINLKCDDDDESSQQSEDGVDNPLALLSPLLSPLLSSYRKDQIATQEFFYQYLFFTQKKLQEYFDLPITDSLDISKCCRAPLSSVKSSTKI